MTPAPPFDLQGLAMTGGGVAAIGLALRYLWPLLQSASARTQAHNEADKDLVDNLRAERDRATQRLDAAEDQLRQSLLKYHQLEMQMVNMKRDLEQALATVEQLRQRIEIREASHAPQQ